MRKSWWLILLLIVLALSAVPVLAQVEEPPTDDAVNEVAGGMYCPVCENIPLDVCPTQACAQWRDLIREKLAQGWSEQRIRDYFAAQYGDRVLSEPPGHWLNWLTYTLVGLGILVGAALLLVGVLRSNRTREAQLASEGQPATNLAGDRYIASLEAELRQREGKD